MINDLRISTYIKSFLPHRKICIYSLSTQLSSNSVDARIHRWFEAPLETVERAIYKAADSAIEKRWSSIKPLRKVPQIEAALSEAEEQFWRKLKADLKDAVQPMSPKYCENAGVVPASLRFKFLCFAHSILVNPQVFTERHLSSLDALCFRIITETVRPPMEQFIDAQAARILYNNSVELLSHRIERALATNQPPTTALARAHLEEVYKALCKEEGFGRKLMEAVVEEGVKSIEQLVEKLRSETHTRCRKEKIEAELELLEKSALPEEKSPREKLLDGVKTQADKGKPIYFSFTAKVLDAFEAHGGDLALVVERIEEATSYDGHHLKMCDSLNFYGYKYRIKDEMEGGKNSKFQFYSSVASPQLEPKSNRLIYIFDSFENHRQDTTKTKKKAIESKKNANAIKLEQKRQAKREARASGGARKTA